MTPNLTHTAIDRPINTTEREVFPFFEECLLRKTRTRNKIVPKMYNDTASVEGYNRTPMWP